MRGPRARRQRGEGGYAAVLVAVVIATVGLACASIAIDTGQWYVEAQRAQKAADAAALGGVPFLPQDFVSARERALSIAAANGYDNDGVDNVVTVQQGNPATQLKVTISSSITNQFGSMIGSSGTAITRSATSDYQGPAPMGSPCNTFGNEPNPGTRPSSPSPKGSVLGSVDATKCPRSPAFWANVEGPQTGKVQGDRYQTLGCEETGVDGCDANLQNLEYNDFGYVFLVKVQKDFFNLSNGQPTTAKGSIELQLFDPLFTDVGQTCELLPPLTYYTNSGTAQNPSWTTHSAFPDNNNNANSFTSNADARNRYTAPSSNAAATQFCTGDGYAGKADQAVPVTSFVLRQQTDSLNPRLAPVVSTECIRQYSGFDPDPTLTVYTEMRTNNRYRTTRIDPAVLRSPDSEAVTASFHNWTRMCSFTPTRPGDYYLQVRTNVSLGGAVSGLSSTGNLAAAALVGNSTAGSGSNAFAIRAVTPTGLERQVSISGNDHMPIYVNKASGTAEFNLIRVLPGARGQKIAFSYFDAGDSQSSGSVKVLVPTDITGSGTNTPFPGGCTTYGGSADTATATSPAVISQCTAPFAKKDNSALSKNNGRLQTITIPIPSDYNCDFNDFTKCWYRVQIAFGSGTVTDVTTWDATILGDPVRLVS